jgi:hypothetical protein
MGVGNFPVQGEASAAAIAALLQLQQQATVGKNLEPIEQDQPPSAGRDTREPGGIGALKQNLVGLI